MSDLKSSAAQALATFSASLRWDDLPPEVQARSRELVLDFLGVATRGSRDPSSTPLAAVAAYYPGRATVIGRSAGSTAPWAALANGTAGHAIELDDVTRGSSLHPGVSVIPATLAIAEELDADAGAFLTAIVAGYEVTMRVGNALNAASAYKRGFHPTGIAGTFGAAVAAGYLFELDVPELTHALGIAGTMTAGSLEYLSGGAWTKRLNPGWAAHGGIVAAMLAKEGFTGPATVFEGPLGVLTSYTDAPRPEYLLDGLEDGFQIMGVSIKPYACCRYNHGLIDCVLALREEHNLQFEEVESMRLGVLSAGAVLVANPIEQKQKPQNVVDAQFSAPFAAAVALKHGSAGYGEYVQENVDDPAIRALLLNIECYQDASLDSAYPDRWPAAVEIRSHDGGVFSKRVEYPLGDPENPVAHADLIRKFSQLAGTLFPPPTAADVAERILHLEATTPVKEVVTLFSQEERAETP